MQLLSKPLTLFSMKGIPICALIVLFAVHSLAISEQDLVRNTLLEFMAKLSNGKGIPEPNPGWNSSSNPCHGRWRGITCDDQQRYVTEIALNGYNFSGVLDAKFLCGVRPLSASLSVISVSRNRIRGRFLEDIGSCSSLTHLLVARNQFSGIIPESVPQLKNLKVLDLSHNIFAGELPGEFPGNLTVFRVEDNHFSGPIPSSNLPALSEFNVSYNNLIGTIPGWAIRFNMSSFIRNPRLCGPPLPYNCTSVESNKYTEQVSAPPPELASASPPEPGKRSGRSSDQILMFLGYAVISLSILIITVVCVCKKAKMREQKSNADAKVASVNDTMTGLSFSTVELKGKSDFTASVDSGQISASVAVVTSPGMRFDDLLQAPAELLGRGKHGSVYKVVYHGLNLAVKRIKDWPISNSEFRERMRQLNQVKHPAVLPAIAFYSSEEEKLMVYEYQPNGSLFRQIHSPANQQFNWSSRISAAAAIADALAFIHTELQRDRIPHGNLKSSNILLNSNMQPCISEYGLMLEGNHITQGDYRVLFNADTYAFGVILLELLTGKMALDNGVDLASWVLAVVREEWTVEVFDRILLHEGASEEMMVNALQMAIKCVNGLPEARPSMKYVAAGMAAIRDDEEQSIEALDLSLTRSFVDL